MCHLFLISCSFRKLQCIKLPPRRGSIASSRSISFPILKIGIKRSTKLKCIETLKKRFGLQRPWQRIGEETYFCTVYVLDRINSIDQSK